MLLDNPFHDAFGLDIGDLSIKLIRLAKHNRFRQTPYFSVADVRTVALPPGYIVDGELQQPELVRKKLLFLLGKEGKKYRPIRSPWVVADLPEPKTFLKLIEIDTPPDQITIDDVNMHARRHLPYELEETYLDWYVVNASDQNAKKSQVLIGAATKVIADSYTYLLDSVGLTPITMEIEAIALARALITASKSYEGEARILLDLGATRSSMVIYDNSSIQFSATLQFSGELLTTAISQELKIDYEQAENLKIANGLAYDKTRPKYLPVVARAVDDLIAEIKKTIVFYQEHFTNVNPVTHITMCGGLARLKNIDNVLSQKLNIPTYPGHPWKNLNNDKKFSEQDNIDATAMASAIGLALRASANIL
ncbi:MAG: type IV pilus assembly protein PilM [Candidatus Magasanikbacteria bacterium]|jgi:type IV pilus assembly protein PilM